MCKKALAWQEGQSAIKEGARARYVLNRATSVYGTQSIRDAMRILKLLGAVKKIAIIIRQYSGTGYNAVLFDQRGESCEQ
jgi:hypothetical protein